MQARVSGNVDEMGIERTPGRRSSRSGLGGVTSHSLLREQPIAGKKEGGSYSKSDKATTAAIHGPKVLSVSLSRIDHVSMTPD
jgi:hypothetical protein